MRRICCLCISIKCCLDDRQHISVLLCKEVIAWCDDTTMEVLADRYAILFDDRRSAVPELLGNQHPVAVPRSCHSLLL